MIRLLRYISTKARRKKNFEIQCQVHANTYQIVMYKRLELKLLGLIWVAMTKYSFSYYVMRFAVGGKETRIKIGF